jgi:ferredoxin
MKTKLYYFTGTGNTLWVGKALRDLLPDAELLPLVQLARQDEIALSARCIGFLFPLYFLGLPEIVYRVISRADMSACEYVFGLTTCGGLPVAETGGTRWMQEALRAPVHGGQPRNLDAFFYLWMPGNFVPGYGAYPEFVQRWQLRMAARRVARIARLVAAQTTHVERGNRLTAALTKDTYTDWIAKLGAADRAYRVEPQCNSCGVCERVCPVENIVLQDRKPAWLGHCQQCMACMQLCPQQAIQYGEETKGRTRYRNPEIRVREIVEQKAEIRQT